MIWHLSHKFDPRALPLADRHYTDVFHDHDVGSVALNSGVSVSVHADARLGPAPISLMVSGDHWDGPVSMTVAEVLRLRTLLDAAISRVPRESVRRHGRGQSSA